MAFFHHEKLAKTWFVALTHAQCIRDKRMPFPGLAYEVIQSSYVHSEYTHGYQHITPSTLNVHPWLPTHHSKYTQSTSMATNTSLQVHSAYIRMANQHSTLNVHPWLPTHHSKYTQRTPMATNTSSLKSIINSQCIDTRLLSHDPV